MMKRRHAIAAAGAAAVLTQLGDWSADAQAKPAVSPVAMDKLFLEFSKSAGFSAEFVEEKQIALLKQPIVNHGRLYFSPSALFARHIDRPFRSAILLKHRELTLWDGTATKVLNLEQNPGVAALATSFLSLLRGDRKALDRNYRVEFRGSFDNWEVQLLPSQKDLQHMIRSLTFWGGGLSISRLKLAEASGDWSETRFERVMTNRTFSDAEKQRYFSVPKT
jgi:outer membrane lipoprotein-sorting protein